jgi:hypothetical protein
MEMSPWEVTSRSVTKNFPCFMQSAGSLPSSQETALVSILSQINSTHTTPSNVSKIYFNIIFQPACWYL